MWSCNILGNIDYRMYTHVNSMKITQGILSSYSLLVVSTWYQSLGLEFENFFSNLRLSEGVTFETPT